MKTAASQRLTFARGFTLAEMAVVLVIVALLIAGMLLPLSAQQDIRARQENEKILKDIQEALLGFAAANKRLPCADTDGDGSEDCSSSEGDLPYITLGIGRGDYYGWRIRYRVAPNFIATGITTTSNGNITVRSRGDDIATTGVTETKFLLTLTNNAAAVIWSVGKNGRGGTSINNTPGPTVLAGTDEEQNNTLSSDKISRISAAEASGCSDTAEGSPFCEFDDIVFWVSPSILIGRLITAGQLP